MANGNLSRFLGGSPVSVLIRLVLISLLVGVVLVWLNLTPAGLFRSVEAAVRSFISGGFDGVREVGRYIITGAMIVVPIWLLLRFLDMRGRK
jgi:uncharacterized oligopeptide transporter (OPT) family protein